MNFRNAWLVFKKDWSEIKQSKQILLPIIALPIVIVVILPTIAIQVPSALVGGGATSSMIGVSNFTSSQLGSILSGMTSRQSFVYVMSTVVFAPFTLLVPLLVSSIISSDSFAGEKERKTIEGLLATPLSDLELLLGKMMGALIPALVATWSSAVIFMLLTDYLDYPLFGYLILPNAIWIVILLGLTPAFAVAAIGLSVIISSRVNGSREAQQLTGLLVIPILILMLGEMSGALSLGIIALFALLGGVLLLDAMILRVGMKLFSRERILAKF
jgi:ABC-2 type transport system permease protein